MDSRALLALNSGSPSTRGNSVILIFAGAGASKAVDPKSYPTTQEFFRRLPGNIADDALFAGLAQFVRTRVGSEVIDIEQWLWAAAEARDVYSALARHDHPAGWLFGENRVNAMVNSSLDLRAPVGVGSSVVVRLEHLEEAINRRIYEYYRQRPSRESLGGTWVPLLRGLASRDPYLELFTTNYDVVLEEAIVAAELPIDTGRRTGVYAEIDETMWLVSDAGSLSPRGLLTKLHGSVDWSRIGDQIYFGTPKFTGEHDNQVIIYPGYKGIPERRPFTLFHEHFSRCVENADAALFIGFAFRDQYINQVLRDRLAPNARVVVLNPAPSLPTLPFSDERLVHLKHGLDQQGISKVLEALGTTQPSREH